jgi:hypothetical protein
VSRVRWERIPADLRPALRKAAQEAGAKARAQTRGSAVSDVEDAIQAVHNGADGVGLLRTEFLYLGRQSMPAEEEQVQEAAEFGGRFRSLQLVRSQSVVDQRENGVRHRVPQQQRQQESQPAHVDEVQVRMKIAPRGAVNQPKKFAILLRFAEYCDTQVGCHSERSEESAFGRV